MINESVRLVANNLLNEMFIEGKTKLGNGSHILAYRSKIWVFAPDDYDGTKRMWNSITKEAQLKGRLSSIGDLSSDRADILHGIFKIEKYGNRIHKTLEIVAGDNFQHNMDTSPLVKKTAQTLGANDVVFNDQQTGDLLQSSDTEDLKPDAPTWGYHGTSSEYIQSIMKTGLRPRPEQTNFKDVEHQDTIFLTLDPNKAIFHATQAIDKDRSGRRGGRRGDDGLDRYNAIILRVKIPDKNLLTADYDIDTETSQTTYTDMIHNMGNEHILKKRGTMPGDPNKLSQHVGVFGYKGTILPQQITDVYVANRLEDSEPPTFDAFRRFNPRYVIETLKRFSDAGYDMDYMAESGIDLREALQHPDMFLSELEDREDEDA